MGNALEEFREHLSRVPPEQNMPASKVVGLLAQCWGELAGDLGGMEPHKLAGRMENICWQPPLLTFEIERHGATVLGSVYAEVQRWTVNVDRASVELAPYTQKRQVGFKQKPLKVAPIAEEVAGLILAGKEDERLNWYNPSKVRILMGYVLPEGSAVKETLMKRRRRLSQAIEKKLADHGWKKISSQHTYEKTPTDVSQTPS